MRKVSLFAFLGVLMAASSGHASDAGPGYVSSILITPEGVVLFSVSGPRTTPPSCQGTGLGARWGFNGATPAGQVKLATILSAFSMHKPIGITGSGACTDWGDTETPTYISMNE